MTADPYDLATRRVEHALRRFQVSWEKRGDDATDVSRHLDELDVAVGLWLDLAREHHAQTKRTTSKGNGS